MQVVDGSSECGYNEEKERWRKGMNEFGNYLYALRRAKGMTQAELADRLGLTNKAISKWETGEAFPETAQLVPLANIFGVTVDELLRGRSAREDEQSETAQIRIEKETVASAEQRGETRAEDLARKFRPEKWAVKFAVWIGIGVILSVAGIVALILSGILAEEESGLHISVTIAMLAAFTLSADIFTAAGIVHERYFLPAEGQTWKARVRRFIVFMVAGITAGGAGVCAFLSGAFFAEGGMFEDNVRLAVSVGGGLALFALAAFFFIYGGITWDAYCKKVCEREQEKERSEILQIIRENEWKEDSLAAKLCSAVMIVATAVFLLLGFLWDLWSKAWICFVVGGLLCGIVNVWFEKKKK